VWTLTEWPIHFAAIATGTPTRANSDRIGMTQGIRNMGHIPQPKASTQSAKELSNNGEGGIRTHGPFRDIRFQVGTIAQCGPCEVIGKLLPSAAQAPNTENPNRGPKAECDQPPTTHPAAAECEYLFRFPWCRGRRHDAASKGFFSRLWGFRQPHDRFPRYHPPPSEQSAGDKNTGISTR
jgi:hypothetical protein